MIKLQQKVLAMLGAIVMNGCMTVQDSEDERKQFNVIPDSKMNALGAEAYAEIKTKEKISTNASLNEIVSRIGKRIADASGAQFDWEFTVIESPETVNAFCLPGGKIAVYTGILPVAKTEAALAAILGHEVAHAVARHAAERMSQQMVFNASKEIANEIFKDSDKKEAAMSAMGAGAAYGVLLPFSRKHESEADRIGLTYMARAGYNPDAAPDLWNRMAGLEKKKVPEYESTHPSDERREKDLRNAIPDVKDDYDASDKQIDRDLPAI